MIDGLQRMVHKLPAHLDSHISSQPELTAPSNGGIQLGLSSGINGNTRAGGTRRLFLAQRSLGASLGLGGYEHLCVLVCVVVFSSRLAECVHKCTHPAPI